MELPLALRDRACGFLEQRGSASDDELLSEMFGGTPPATLRDRLLAPLSSDPRLRRVAGRWSLTRPSLEAELSTADVTTLAIAATGPRATRHRLLGLAALRVEASRVVGRYSAAFNPGVRVPGYVARRSRLGDASVDELPAFADLLDDLLAFLGTRPVCAQEARATWSFVEHEARRAGRAPVTPALVDVNALAVLLLDLPGKPSLPAIAQRLGIGVVHVGQPDDEARVLAEAISALFVLAEATGLRTLSALERALAERAPAGATPLRRAETARALPDAPGVYWLRDAQDEVLYVGKARRLRSRLQAYVHRPLGATRRLEGLAERVSAVQTTVCASDLQALIVEDREIRRLQPRYNTQRSRRRPRAWLRLAGGAAPTVSKRRRALPRLSVCDGPLEGDSADKLLGPFRNEAAAESARQLARELFDLDRLRRSADAHAYLEALQAAWAFLQGAPEAHRRATDTVRNHLLTARQARDHALARRLERLLARVLAYDIAQLRVPADPRQARFALARPAPGGGVEVFVLEAGILVGQAHVPPDDLTELLARPTPCTDIADRPVVLRWLGAQRSPARLVYLGNDGLAELLEAVSDLLAADA